MALGAGKGVFRPCSILTGCAEDRLQMTGGWQAERRDTDIRSRIFSAFAFLAALLMLYGAVPPFKGAGAGQRGPILDRVGSLAADERLSPPSIQPRGPVPSVISELRGPAAKQGLAPDRDVPSALAAAPDATPSSWAGEKLGPVAAAFRLPVVPRAFDARAPPNRT